MVVFDLGKPGKVEFRLQCGYQPVNITYWTPPADTPDVPDNPPETTTRPETTTQPETTTLEPKKPDKGPQSQGEGQSGYEDFGGGENHENQTELTPEPTSPTKYTPPAPPTTEPPSTTKKAETTTKRHTETTTSSGSKTVDEQNGQTETRTEKSDNGKTTTKVYEVVAGDGTSRQNLDEVQEEYHSPSTVEEPVCGDGLNQGDLDPGAVE